MLLVARFGQYVCDLSALKQVSNQPRTLLLLLATARGSSALLRDRDGLNREAQDIPRLPFNIHLRTKCGCRAGRGGLWITPRIALLEKRVRLEGQQMVQTSEKSVEIGGWCLRRGIDMDPNDLARRRVAPILAVSGAPSRHNSIILELCPTPGVDLYAPERITDCVRKLVACLASAVPQSPQLLRSYPDRCR